MKKLILLLFILLSMGYGISYGAAVITKIDPVYVYIGDNDGIYITVEGTQLIPGQTTVSFSGSGITVVSAEVNQYSTYAVWVDVIVSPDAVFGFRDITIQNGAEIISKSNAIYLVGQGCEPAYPVRCQNRSGCCPEDAPYCGSEKECYSQPVTTTTTTAMPAVITEVNPPYIEIGDEARIEIYVTGTELNPQQTTVSFSGSGITIASVDVGGVYTGSKGITVYAIVSPDAVFGFRDITIQNGAEIISKTDAIYLVGQGCEPAYPVRCSNYCCPANYPYCGSNRKCYSQPQQPGACVADAVFEGDTESLSLLREFRDNILLKTETGKKYVDLYYQYSPTIVTSIEQNPKLKQQMKAAIMAIMPKIKQRLKGLPHDK